MDDGYFQILVFVLSAVLAVALLLAIVMLVKSIQVVNDVKEITKKAGSVADKFEHISEIFQKSAGPILAAKLLAHVSKMFKTKSVKSQKEKDDE